MPSEESVFGKFFVIFLRSIEHHFNHTFYISVCYDNTGKIQSQPAGDG
jgi:hypothetical protein